MLDEAKLFVSQLFRNHVDIASSFSWYVLSLPEIQFKLANL
jgi:hypothetical protein